MGKNKSIAFFTNVFAFPVKLFQNLLSSSFSKKKNNKKKNAISKTLKNIVVSPPSHVISLHHVPLGAP